MDKTLCAGCTHWRSLTGRSNGKYACHYYIDTGHRRKDAPPSECAVNRAMPPAPPPRKPVVFGYARVSSRDQNEERQLVSLTEAGVQPENITVEKQSGKDFDRPLYRALVRKMCEGDTLMVASIDRLGRNYDDILSEWRYLTKEKRVEIVVLDMPLLDTRQDKGLTGRLISDIVLQLLSYVAQSERENIRKRQAEGIAAARARGVHFGRTEKPLPENFAEVSARWKHGELTLTAAAKTCGMPISSFRYRAGKEAQPCSTETP